MYKMFAAGLLALTFAPPAYAAEATSLPDLAATPRPFDWTGVHFGATGGYGGGFGPVDRGRLRHSSADGATSASASIESATVGFGYLLAGAALGYDHRLPGEVIVGLEADWSRIVADVTPRIGVAATRTLSVSDLGWFATLRARLGYGLFDRFLPYLTGGVAYSKIGANVVAGFPGTSVAASAAIGAGSGAKPGWTAGAGVEYALTDEISVKTEYLYSEFGGAAIPIAAASASAAPALALLSTPKVGVHTMRGGVSWRPGRPDGDQALLAFASRAGAPRPGFERSGLYFGLGGGFAGGGGRADLDRFQPNGAGFSSDSTKTAVGFGDRLLGAVAGYDHVVDGRIIVGLAADFYGGLLGTRVIDAAAQSGMTSAAGLYLLETGDLSHRNARIEHRWSATARARLGYALLERLTAYVTAGLAISKIEAKFASSTLSSLLAQTFRPAAVHAAGRWSASSGAASDVEIGWTAGAGAEYALTERIALWTEYLFSQFGGSTIPIATLSSTGALSFGSMSTAPIGVHLLRGGVSWKFFAPDLGQLLGSA